MGSKCESIHSNAFLLDLLWIVQKMQGWDNLVLITSEVFYFRDWYFHVNLIHYWERWFFFNLQKYWCGVYHKESFLWFWCILFFLITNFFLHSYILIIHKDSIRIILKTIIYFYAFQIQRTMTAPPIVARRKTKFSCLKGLQHNYISYMKYNWDK